MNCTWLIHGLSIAFRYAFSPEPMRPMTHWLLCFFLLQYRFFRSPINLYTMFRSPIRFAAIWLCMSMFAIAQTPETTSNEPVVESLGAVTQVVDSPAPVDLDSAAGVPETAPEAAVETPSVQAEETKTEQTWLDRFTACVDAIDSFVWGTPLIVLILAGGLLLTIRLGGMQFLQLPRALRYMIRNEEGGKGEVSSFAALCTALSATVGPGNIVGVATAVVAGGPGAMFWMWIAALVGMATKYAEGLLAVKYRDHDPATGHVLGGPFYYIERGMGPKFRWLAKLFAVFGIMVGLFGIGTFTQVNSISGAFTNFFDPNRAHTVTIFDNTYSLVTIGGSVILAILVGLVLIGGLKRIAAVSEKLIPFMVALYFIVAMVLIVYNYRAIPAALREIVASAFGFRPIAGATMGAAIMMAMQKGVARGIFSNEAGLGSAPIAAAAAQTHEPVRQGLVSMTGTFLDTIVVCSLTGLSIIMTGAHNLGYDGSAVTTKAFEMGLPFLPPVIPAFIVMISLVLFGFTTILGWDYYSERCLEYLTNGDMKFVLLYRWLYIVAVFIGPYMTISAVWGIADICNGLMAIPNMIALIFLSGTVARETRSYFQRLKNGDLKD